jgi:ribonuclease E
MNKSILIDAAHKEETRIAVLENGILQDFDREALAIKQIKGNIYLAKVTRVEASLQSAFVNYGSDRHGFLPFSDISTDYYQMSDTEKQKIKDLAKESINKDKEEVKEESKENYGEENNSNSINKDDQAIDRVNDVTIGSYSVEEETDLNSSNSNNFYKRYNIQDVIKPGQLILVQVTKEERGNKGASMTTYISLAGKYCVLMANTSGKGGVSKKVDNFRDRKILRSILEDINVPTDKSVIIRTAGVGKKPDDIKRDYDYLARVWNSIRDAAIGSKSPTFIHAEDDIIKKCIRDVYNESVNEVVVEGKEAFEAVMSFVRLTMPEGIANVKLHDERVPIFNKYKVEQQISSLYEKQVLLPSGGSIVIDHTEALVAIDVNSGRATREAGIEETAYNTNLEAVKEIARQLKLRDLAGLVVIDFIDMYDQRHKRNIERFLRDALAFDRARIQLGRIGSFGLMEMSRQRLGTSFFETITEPCVHCNGTGYVRSVEIVAVSILRAIRHSCVDKQAGAIHVYTPSEVMAYILNYKRNEINATEKNYGIHIFLHNDENAGINGFNIKKRKGLSDEEKRELEIEVLTGKVNQMGIERSLIEEINDELPNNKKDHSDQYNNDNRNKNNKGNRNRNRDKNSKDGRGNHQKNKNINSPDNKKTGKSLFSSIFSLFKK